ncbi:UBX domain-containing protein 10 [Lampris incognitus]|uniref:UBX domain-containing protein 10 n=1 Tax=Lampris incognitus TaxID=2546036 RepID=UPI0024B52323|nr:UBX domain-containing protein 10 [Lampris incognitus]
MHLTRPKSSKGRSRPAVYQAPQRDETAGNQDISLTPKSPAAYNRSEGYLRSWSQPIINQNDQPSQDEVTHMLQSATTVPKLSLNKYKVLPSIMKRDSGTSLVGGIERMTSNNPSDGIILHQQQRHGEPYLSTAVPCSNPEISNSINVHSAVTSKPPGPMMTVETEKDNSLPSATGSILLAVRAPCGRRFQEQFAYTDTLLTVIASAEARNETKYESPFIETMDVPRRTFTDLNSTLAQCRILDRSVVCISEEDSSGDA